MGQVYLRSKGNKWHCRWIVLSNNELLIFKKSYVGRLIFNFE